MSKLLIPIILITLILGILWFFIFPGREKKLTDWVNEQKAVIFKENSVANVTRDNYELLKYEFPNTDSNNKWRLVLVKVNPQDFDFDLIINSDQTFAIADIAKEEGCNIAVNGIFYDTQFKPLGLIVEDGVVKNPVHLGELASGVFYIASSNETGIVPSSDYVIENDKLALQAGPMILKSDGTTEISKNGNEIDARTIIGIDEENQVYLGVVHPKVEAGLTGVSLYDLAKIFQNSQEKLGFKIKAVLNLDGGSSTGLYTKNFYLAEKNVPENVVCLKEGKR